MKRNPYYARLAATIFDTAEADVTDEQYQSAKAAQFGQLYGGGQHIIDVLQNLTIEGLSNLFALKCDAIFALMRDRDGEWCMYFPMGDDMAPVPGSCKSTIRDMLHYCLDRWENIAPGHPFVYIVAEEDDT